jgi:hypothetical protein
VIAVDTNLLVYAHRGDSEWHAAAAEVVRGLAENTRWAIPWPCIYELYAVVTHPRIYRPPSTAEQVLRQIDTWRASPGLSLIGETDAGWPTIATLARTAKVTGPAIHDARIAAICIQHGVSELWSCDRDFSRFRELRVVNPLVPASGARERRLRYGSIGR